MTPPPTTTEVSDNKNEPTSPPSTDRSSLAVPPPLTPVSPPTFNKSMSSGDSTDAGFSFTSDDDMEKESEAVEEAAAATAAAPAVTETEATPPMISPVMVTSEYALSATMPSLASMSTDRPSTERRKKTVREMLQANENSNNNDDEYPDDIDHADHDKKKKSSLPIRFPVLDASRGDLYLSTPTTTPTQSTPPKVNSAFSAPGASQSIRGPPLLVSPTQPGPMSESETKMKQAIKDHMQSMESRVSKLRELNKQSATSYSTPSTAALTPGSSGDTPRTLFPEDDHHDISSANVEKILTRAMESLSESLLVAIEDATKNSVDTRMSDIEALLQRKLVQMQKAVSLASSANGPPVSPKRSPDLRALEDFIDGRMDQLTELIEATQEKLIQEVTVARANVEVEGEETTIPASTILKHLQDALDKRMDTMESLVQLTATELETNTKAAQQRMHQKLLEQVMVSLHSDIPPGDASIATSHYPTVYGDDDSDSDHQDEQDKNANNNITRRGHRSLEAELVAMDRQASIRDIYGDMEIDDVDVQSSGGEVTEHSRGGLGRAKSLRDLCNIDTIEEDDEEEEPDDGTSRISDFGGESVTSEISARSASLRHIYGDGGIDIDDNKKKAGTVAESNKRFDTPPVVAKRSISVATIATKGEASGDRSESESKDEATDRAPWRADRAQSSKRDMPPSPVTRGPTSRQSPVRDRPLLMVDRAMTHDSRQDHPPQSVDRAVSTRAIYGEFEIDDEAKQAALTDILESKSPTDRKSSVVVAVDGTPRGEGKRKVNEHGGLPEIPEIFDFYDGLDIDVGGDNGSDDQETQVDDGIYDDLSLDGVDETNAFVNSMDSSIDSCDSDLDEMDEPAPIDIDIDDTVHLEDTNDVENSEDEDDADDRSEKDNEEKQASVSIDEGSKDSDSGSEYDSDSSGEDEQYFHDHRRQHLAVLARSMAKVRNANKATRRYRKFQANIFVARRDGPLAVKVRSVADYDEAENDEVEHAGNKMTFSDDECSRGESVPDAERAVSDSSATESSASEEDYAEGYQTEEERAKANAWTVAMAVTGKRTADRAIKRYRRMLQGKFLPYKRKGPMALNDKSERLDSSHVNSYHTSDSSSTSEVYVDKTGLRDEALTGSMASIDTHGDANEESYRDMSQPSIDTRPGQDMSDNADDSRRDGDDDNDIDEGEDIDEENDIDEDDNIDDGGVNASDMDESKASEASIPSIDTEGDDEENKKSSGVATSTAESLNGSTVSNDSGSEFPPSTLHSGSIFAHTSENVVIDEPPTRRGTQTTSASDTVDSCWNKELHDESDSDTEPDSSRPAADLSATKIDHKQGQETIESASPASSEDDENYDDQSKSSIFRRVGAPEASPDAGGEDVKTQGTESPTRALYKRSLDDDQSLGLGDHQTGTAPSSSPLPAEKGRQSPLYEEKDKTAQTKDPPPAYAAFDDAGEDMTESEVEQLENVAVLARTQEMDLEQDKPSDVWGAIASQSPANDDSPSRPARSSPHEAEAGEEEGAFKPEQMSKSPTRPQSPVEDAGQKPSPKADSEGDVFETAKTDDKDVTTDGKSSGEEKEMEEWEAVDKGSTKRDQGSYSDEIAIHMQTLTSQMQKWEELILATNQNQKACNDAVRTSSESLRISNESLQSSVQESIEDSHHFAAYLDKMMSERIGQLEAAIRSLAIVVPPQPMAAQGLSSTPERARSAPTTPLRGNWSEPAGLAARSIPVGGDDGESKEAEHERELRMNSVSSMVVEVTEWKRLQEKLRGTEEVAENYRKQVLQLRSVLEVKINEGNASQHQVELLQQRLQEAHDREILAQKQLRPVTRRVEQVIQEMVQLEELSANLQEENGRLREQLWMNRREF